MNDIVLSLRQFVLQIAGMVVGAVAAVALHSTLELTLVAGFFTLLLAMVLGGFLGTLLERVVNQRSVRRWQEKHDRDPEDAPLVIVAPYRHPSPAGDLIDRLDRLAGPASPDHGGVHPEEFTKAQMLVMRAIRAEQVDHRADATRIAATSYLNSLTTPR